MLGIFDGVLLCTDLDGTFLVNAKASEENCRAIRYFQENGGLFTVATGRSPVFVRGFENYAPNAPLIVCNGTMICDHMTRKTIKTFPMPDYVPRVLNGLRDSKLLSDIFLYDMYDGGTDIDDQKFRHWNASMEVPPGEYLLQTPKPWLKMLFEMREPEDTYALQNIILARYPGMFEVARSYPRGLELHAPGSGKGACVEYLRRKLPGIRLVVGAGDFDNDISLLRSADIGYAVANAQPDVIAAADRVTVSCEEHAIAKIIEEIGEMI